MSSDSSFNRDKAVEAYLLMMHELAIRADLIAQACDGKLNLTAPFAREFAYLQFRRICELIALGCLHLHGDIQLAQQQVLKKEWHAEKIMRLLQKQHPHAFPQPITRTKTDVGWHIEGNCKPEALTYEQFKKLYSECGEVLHRGTIQSAGTATHCTQADYEKVVLWQRRIVNLMNDHLVSQASGQGMYITSIRTETGYPQCSIFDIQGANEIVACTKTITVSDEIIHAYVSNHWRDLNP